MIASMCSSFGEPIGRLHNIDYYSFPTVARLAQEDVEPKLRQLSFGYRAKFISQAAVYLQKNFTNSDFSPEKWLNSLRTQRNYAECHAELVKVPGIGRKVADCVCLMSLDKLDAVPIDTHVLSIARNVYSFSSIQQAGKQSRNNSLSQKVYKAIGSSII